MPTRAKLADGMAGTSDRRSFLASLAACSLVAGVAGRSRAAEPLRLGLIGLGNSGRRLLQVARGQQGVEVVALCDVDKSRLAECAGTLARPCAQFVDYRELLETADLQGVILATPDHWHAPIGLAALHSGHDLYVETPLALTVTEGREIVDAATRLGRVVQVGNSHRGAAPIRTAVELIRSGRLGKIETVRAWCTGGESAAPVPDQAPPADLDWDRWLGPAPEVPYNPQRAHRHWRFYWDYGGGLLAEQGSRLLDLVHWATGLSAPLNVQARATYDLANAYETPTSLDVTYEYPGFHLSWSQNSWRGKPETPDGLVFIGSRGRLYLEHNNYQIQPEGLAIHPIGPGDFELPRPAGHFEEWVDCLRSREQPSADVASGHAAATTAHLGNLAARLQRTLTWSAADERFVNDPAADRWLSRPTRAPYDR